MKERIKKMIWGGGVVGIIILGVITNATWDLLKPIGSFLFRVILNLSVLGIGKFKDGIYREIAKSFHEDVSLKIFINVSGVFFAFLISFVLFSLLMRKKYSLLVVKKILAILF